MGRDVWSERERAQKAQAWADTLLAVSGKQGRGLGRRVSKGYEEESRVSNPLVNFQSRGTGYRLLYA